MLGVKRRSWQNCGAKTGRDRLSQGLDRKSKEKDGRNGQLDLWGPRAEADDALALCAVCACACVGQTLNAWCLNASKNQERRERTS